jgi:hypothetical protein
VLCGWLASGSAHHGVEAVPSPYVAGGTGAKRLAFRSQHGCAEAAEHLFFLQAVD